MKRFFTLAIVGLIATLVASTNASAQDCQSGHCGGSILSHDGFIESGDRFDGEIIHDGEIISEDGFVGDMSSGAVYGQRRGFGQSDLFYNYYTQGNANLTNAQMSISPGPVPPNVGHTFYTYQPFYPHHMLHPHRDRYHNYYDGGRGLNRTKASYWYPPVRTGIQNLYWNFLRIPR